jgi:hypothetical protein
MPVEYVRGSEVDDDVVREFNQLVTLVNELKSILNAHITGGQHRTAASVNASATLVTAADADTFYLGY